MKIAVYELQPQGGRVLLLETDAFQPSSRRNFGVVMDEVCEYALRTAITPVFSSAFGVSKDRITMNDGVAVQRVRCSGRNIQMEVVDGKVTPVEDRSSPDRVFEIEAEIPSTEADAVRIAGARILSVHVVNYRPIIDLKIDFFNSGSVSLLAGLNGCGKSSVVEACVHAMALRLNVRPEPEQDFSITLELADRDGRRYAILKTPVNHKLYDAEGQEIASSTAEVRKMVDGTSYFLFSSWRAPVLNGGVGLRVRSVRRVASYRDTDMLPQIKTFLVNRYVYNRVEGDSPLGLPVEQRPQRDVLKILNTIWAMFYPEEPGEFVVDRKRPSKATDPATDLRFDVYLRRSPDSAPVSVDDLSAGELEIFTFIGILVARIPPYDIVFIDEPELHLNRIWHRTILKALAVASPNTQFIVTTHAPEIWESAFSRQRFYIGTDWSKMGKFIGSGSEGGDDVNA